MPEILIVIPARGGSKGIPRKNLRLLGGKPLIYYSIKNALSVENADVYVTTEDAEIELISKKFGAKVHKRPSNLADDKSTLDPVIFNALEYAESRENKSYDLVVTMQPTSPLLSKESIQCALLKITEDTSIHTIISAQDDTHLSWKIEGEKFIPNYTERLNRQYLQPIYRETGGFLITRRPYVCFNNRIGPEVSLFILNNGEEIDIDTFNDWNLCEYLLKKKKILFVVSGNNILGLGHVYNSLILANDILNHDIEFLVTKGCELALEKIRSKNYNVSIQQKEKLSDDVIGFKPDIVVNDILDTSTEYIRSLKDVGIKVINFEDLGDGAKIADVVINAIYPEQECLKNHFFGENYFILRDEFVFNHNEKKISDVKEVLITFGGVDPSNLTNKTLSSIYHFCIEKNIKITVVTGLGYTRYDSLTDFSDIELLTNVQNISDYMYRADIIFTSAGRTVYEVASIGTPAIVLAQNDRELTHFFAFEKYGFINLGLGTKVDNFNIKNNFKNLVENKVQRIQNHELMLKHNLKLGRKRVQKLIQQTI